jgi:hypothetical protein
VVEIANALSTFALLFTFSSLLMTFPLTHHSGDDASADVAMTPLSAQMTAKPMKTAFVLDMTNLHLPASIQLPKYSRRLEQHAE